MDSVPEEAVIESESDRLTTLPLDLIHHILSFMDMKYAVQTCVLSSKWKHIWTTLRHIKLSTSEFEQLGQFSRFTRHVIANRNDQTDVSSLDFTFDGTLSQILVKVLLNYVVSHNVRNLTISTSERDRKLPICIFESQSLKHLTLTNIDEDYCIVPKYPWDLPNLTTLHLNDIVLSDGRAENYQYLDLFSKCVNLKNLIIKDCYMAEVLVFKVSAPRLENLTLDSCFLLKLFISAPKLSSFVYSGEYPLTLSTNGLPCLEKVNLRMPLLIPLSNFERKDACHLVKLLNEFHNAIFLNFHSNFIEVCSWVSFKSFLLSTFGDYANFLKSSVNNLFVVFEFCVKALSLYPDLLSSQPSPFYNLKHLNICEGKCTKLIVPNHVRNYFLHSSPSATITTVVV